MAKYSKWLGGVLGWGFGGPIGALLGFALGSMFDDSSLSVEEKHKRRVQQGRYHSTGGDFNSALLVLSAAVMKADGKLMKSELEYIRNYFTKAFGQAIAAEQIGLLKELLKQDIDVKAVSEQIRIVLEHPMRLQLLHYLFGIAKSDGAVEESELELITRISNYMRISEKDFESIQAMFVKDTNSAYKILEIEPTATDDEVKNAFRRMARKYHPDKLRDLGEEHVKKAQEKFVKVTESYEAIKKKRGIK